MKRDDRHKVKADTDQRHANPNQTKAADHERYISGNIYVRGEIEAKRPPDLTKEHHAEREEDKTSDKRKFVVEIATLVVVAIYAGLTAWQGSMTHDLVKAAQDTYNASERPYIGVDGYQTKYLKNGPDGKTVFLDERDKDTKNLAFKVVVKNFGPVPGDNFFVDWKFFMNGVLQEQEPGSQNTFPSVVFPGQSIYMSGVVGERDYPGVMDRSILLATQVTVRYDGPAQHYTYCEKHEFEPRVNAFMKKGDCPVTKP